MKEHDEKLKKMEKFMEETLDEHGKSHLGVGWTSKEQQALMFDEFFYLLNKQKEPFSLNDLGCGVGDLYKWTQERSLPVSNYYGYDISARMVTEARKIYSDEVAIFEQAQAPTHTSDFSIACGIFNTRLDETEEAWAEYMRDMVITLKEKSRLGFAFNSLTSYVDWKEEHLFYADPLDWFDWCKRNVSRHVTLLHDSPLYVWTIVVRL